MTAYKIFMLGFLVCFLSLTFLTSPVISAAFDFDEGNAPLEIVIPVVIPVIYQSVSPRANDATLVLRITTLLANSWLDAIAPYHPKAVGVYSDLGRQPAQQTDSNRNIAILYAPYRVLNSLLPNHKGVWTDMMTTVGLYPIDDQENTTTPQGIGNIAGNGVVLNREHDGMNQLGDEGGQTYNRIPYSDYLGYQPVNTAYKLKNPSKWQPDIISTGNGLFRVQQFVTPQLRATLPYSYDDPRKYHAPVPTSSNVKHRRDYKAQADEVLMVSA